MAKNIFKAREEYQENVNRSSFDLSHRNNFTTKIGQITPILCQECVPGDSFQIKTDLGLRMAPMVFPIQTPMVATVQYFKVPHRILWKNFEDFIGDTKEGLVHPYISQDYMWHPTSSLADYLGVPSTYASPDETSEISFPIIGRYQTIREVTGDATISADYQGSFDVNDNAVVVSGTGYRFSAAVSSPTTRETLIVPFAYQYSNQGHDGPLANYLFDSAITSANGYYPAYITADITRMVTNNIKLFSNHLPDKLDAYFIFCDNPSSVFDYTEWTLDSHVLRIEQLSTSNEYEINVSPLDVHSNWDFLSYLATLKEQHTNVRLLITSLNSDNISNDGANNIGGYFASDVISAGVNDVSLNDSPFVVQSGEEFPEIRINALPFRAYESIYNCYFRTNTDVDPFIKDGQPEYNKWITNDNDGADSTTPLNLRYRNFELDFLTSAKNSPQQGEAPLVGVSATGTFTFEDENGVQYTAKAIIDENDRLTGIDTYDPELPKASLHRLMDTITHGISINDLRNVSAFQKWKDQNLRRGYRYKDQVMSHFGVDAKSVHYDDPQFIGGMTANVNVQAISSQTSTSEISLGEYGGQATLFESGKHTITTYCDEHCFIIGVLTIVPIPVYSQTLDPMFVKTNMLSYHFPEFNHISMQPIPMKFITPIESYKMQKDTGENELDKTFGYQRPQWEMVSKVDTAHSHMRTDMSNYLMTRYFQNPPELSHDFLVINPEDLTSPFVDTDASADNIVGQIYFDISAQRPVSRMAIPRIEP